MSCKGLTFATALALLLGAGCTKEVGIRADADAGDGGATRFDLNDVSFLYPLPPPSNLAELLPLSSAGAKGELLTDATYAELVAKDSSVGMFKRADFRLVSARVDPCLPNAPPPTTVCAKEIRLVAQPVRVDPTTGATTTSDAALHLFYDLDASAWADVVAGLASLKTLAGKATDGAPLGVHPVLRSEGLRGAYAQALARLVLDHAGDQNLVRVAAAIAPFDQTWDFASFDRTGSGLTATAIPLLGPATSQHFDNTASQPNVGHMTPAPPTNDVSLLLDGARLASASMTDVTAAVMVGLAIDNPKITNRVTTDCISCHVASRADDYAVASRGVDVSGFAQRYVDSRVSLARTAEAADEIQAQRGFGYLGGKTAFTQRTINESAIVAAALSGM